MTQEEEKTQKKEKGKKGGLIFDAFSFCLHYLYI